MITTGTTNNGGGRHYGYNHQHRRHDGKAQDVARRACERVDITPANLSILKNGKAKAIRFSTLEAICRELDCQPGDIIEYRPDQPSEE